MRISESVQSLIHGVSTDDISHRDAVYLEDQVNMLTAETSGLHKRPPALVVSADMLPTIGAGRHYVIKDFAMNQRIWYLVLNVSDTGSGSVTSVVYDDTGTFVTTTGTALANYLKGVLTVDDIDLAVQQDTLHVTNRTKVVAMKTTTRFTDYPSQFIILKPPEQDQTITVRWTGYGVGQKTASITLISPTLTDRGTDTVATLLGVAIAAASNPIEVLIAVTGSVVSVLNRNTEASAEVSIDDGGGGLTAIASNGTLPSPELLPRYANTGDILKIQPLETSDKGAYFMEAIADGDGSTTPLNPVRWIEASQTAEDWELDETTMPHKFIFNGTTFTGTVPTWADKTAGDNITNPNPYFVGKTIYNLGIFQNRLVATSGDTLVTTETNDNTSWWRSTVTQQLPTQPVSIRSTSEQSDNLTSLVTHNKDLLLFTATAQFKLDGSVPLTPQTAGIPLTTKYPHNTLVKPISLGSNVFFATSYGKFTGLLKYKAGSTANIQDAAFDITPHVKRYLPPNPIKLLGDATLGILLAVYSDALYICDMEVNPSETDPLRYAWSKWEGFDDSTGFTILAASLIGNKLQLVMRDSTTDTHMVELTILPDPSVLDSVTYLDYPVEGTILSGNDTLTVSPLYTNPTGNTRLVEKGSGAQVAYTLAAGVVTLDTPVATDTVFIFGTEYECSMKPSRPVIRDASGQVNRYTTIKITSWIANLINSADVWASLTSPFYNYVDQHWSGLITFNQNSQVGVVADQSDDFVIGFNNNPRHMQVKLWSNGHLPFHLGRLEYLGKFTSRGKRF